MPIQAVLLDVGGVFHLPDPVRVLAALDAAGVTVDPDQLPRAHYAGAAALSAAAAADGAGWEGYLHGYLGALGVELALHQAILEAAAGAFIAAGMWSYAIPGSREALADLAATGVRIAIVSNADGTVEQRLADEGVLQVGAGPGVPVDLVIDSGAVGVAKPDPAIFRLALDSLDVGAADAIHVGDMVAYDVAGARAAGIRPVLMDPYDDHAHIDVLRVHALADVVTFVHAENAA